MVMVLQTSDMRAKENIEEVRGQGTGVCFFRLFDDDDGILRRMVVPVMRVMMMVMVVMRVMMMVVTMMVVVVMRVMMMMKVMMMVMLQTSDMRAKENIEEARG